MEHGAWLDSVIEGDSLRRVEERTGVSRVTLSRQINKNQVDAGSIIAIAREYGVNPVHALADTGYLTHEEAHVLPFRDESVSNQRLVRMLAMRIDDDPDAWAGTFDEVVAAATDNVAHLPYAADSSDTEPEEGDDDYHDGP